MRAGTMTLLIPAEPAPLTTDAHGVVRVGKTRVTLDAVIEVFLTGASAEEIVQQYPSLDLADVYSVLGFYLSHRAEVDTYLAERQQQAGAVQRQNEARWDPTGIRERLLARQKTQDC